MELHASDGTVVTLISIVLVDASLAVVAEEEHLDEIKQVPL